MFRVFLLVSSMVLVQMASGSGESESSELEEPRGYLGYTSDSADPEAFAGSHFVTEECAVFDLEGVATQSYKITYNGGDDVTAGCALLFAGVDGGKCAGAPSKTIKLGETLSLTPEDDYFGVKYVSTC